jgi:hypothetical protein
MQSFCFHLPVIDRRSGGSGYRRDRPDGDRPPTGAGCQGSIALLRLWGVLMFVSVLIAVSLLAGVLGGHSP